MLDGQPYSRTEVAEFMEHSGADEQTAILLTMAERIGRLATEDATLAAAARAMDITVVDRERFLREFAIRRRSSSARREAS